MAAISITPTYPDSKIASLDWGMGGMKSDADTAIISIISWGAGDVCCVSG